MDRLEMYLTDECDIRIHVTGSTKKPAGCLYFYASSPESATAGSFEVSLDNFDYRLESGTPKEF